MKKLFFMLVITLLYKSLFSQQLEFFGGPNTNIFRTTNDDQHYKTTYKPGNGYTLGVGIDSLKIDWLILRFVLQYEQYQGKIDKTYTGLAGTSWTNIEVNKSILSLVFFPVNFSAKKIELNIGVQFSRFLVEKYTGYSGGVQIGRQWNNSLNSDKGRYSALTSIGLNARIAYNISLSSKWELCPQYLLYYGFNSEILEERAIRHCLSIGVRKKLK